MSPQVAIFDMVVGFVSCEIINIFVYSSFCLLLSRHNGIYISKLFGIRSAVKHVSSAES
jgi:hypothetical protein